MESFDANTGEIQPMDISMSPEIGKLMEALAKAQGEIKGAVKDSKNPHFKSSYADLASIAEACRAPLSKHGIAVVQIPHNCGRDIAVTTMLGHSSGQWIRGRLSVAPVKFDAQSVGSVTTYLRRYSLAAMAGVAPEDDDGEAAQGRGQSNGGTQMAPPAANNGRTKTAAPKDDEDPAMQKARDEYAAMKKAIQAEETLMNLEDLMDVNRERMAAIKAHSEEGYSQLVALYEKRRRAMAEAA